MTAHPTEIQDALIDFVSKQLLNDRPDIQLGPQDDLLSSNLVDSLGVMRIVAFIEQHYGVQVPPTDVTIENFLNIATISTYLQRRQSEIGQAARS